MKPKWEPVVASNDWGSITLRAGKNGRVLEPEETLRVRWPNGHEEDLRTVRFGVVERVSDHGQLHSSIVTSVVPAAIIDHNGAKLTIRLDLLDVHVRTP